jgi:hypothetical protein
MVDKQFFSRENLVNFNIFPENLNCIPPSDSGLCPLADDTPREQQVVIL